MPVRLVAPRVVLVFCVSSLVFCARTIVTRPGVRVRVLDPQGRPVAGARLTVPWRPDFNALVYVLNGRGRFGLEQRPAGMGQLFAQTIRAGRSAIIPPMNGVK